MKRLALFALLLPVAAFAADKPKAPPLPAPHAAPAPPPAAAPAPAPTETIAIPRQLAQDTLQFISEQPLKAAFPIYQEWAQALRK